MATSDFFRSDYRSASEAFLAALRADAWLHAVPDRPTPHRDAIRRQVRDAFLIDSPAWRAGGWWAEPQVRLAAGRKGMPVMGCLPWR